MEPLCINRTSRTPIKSGIDPIDILSLKQMASILDDISGTFDGDKGFVIIDFRTRNYMPTDHLVAITEDNQVKIKYDFLRESGIAGSATIENGKALDYKEWPVGI